MRDKIADDVKIQHITECIQEIETALDGYTFDRFVVNPVLRIAIVKWLEIIGEATNHISAETKKKNANISWHKMVGLRNLVIHEYFRVDYNIIWDAATVFVPQLKKEIETLELN